MTFTAWVRSARQICATALVLLFAANVTASAQFKELGPAPVSPAAARLQIRTLLDKVDAGNRGQAVTSISRLADWYRDLIDDELIAAWKRDARANLPDVIESLADARVASAIVVFSWRQQRQATFIPAFAPLLGHLMARYADSAQPFLDDLLQPAAPDLSPSEAETVCRILIDMPDLRTWKKSALQILPHYRAAAEDLLARDIQGSDPLKGYAAQRWLKDLAAANPAPSAAPVTHGGAMLTSLDPAAVDDSAKSTPGARALLDLVNRSNAPVDIYWIDYSGNRSLARSALPVGASFSSSTFVTHPFLVVVTGSGGSTAQDTGTRLAAFQAVTPNNAQDGKIRDTGIIRNPDGSIADVAKPAAPVAPGTMGPDGTYKVGNGVSTPIPSFHPGPEYSEVARKLAISGRVLVSLIIDQYGAPQDLHVTRSIGYGLDEKAIEAVRKWRFKPSLKDGQPVSTRASVEVNFAPATRAPNTWYYSGPMTFALEPGLTPPVVKDVAMPNPVRDTVLENAALGFTVDSSGSVKDITFLDGSESAFELLKRSLARWKFQPAANGNGPVEAIGSVRFVKGQAAVAANNPVPPPPIPQNVTPEPIRAPVVAAAATPIPGESIGGKVRRMTERDLVLETPSGKMLRFRLLAKTAFRDKDRNPVRDSLIHPGDQLSVEVSPDDIETAINVIVLKPGSAAERQAASAPVEEARISVPDPSDFSAASVSAPPPAVSPVEPGLRIGSARANVKDGLTYLWIPPGTFTMGCSPGDTQCLDDEKPAHVERIAKGFWLGRTEVTQAAYQRVTGRNPSVHKGAQLPVENVTWNDAAAYCTAIGGRLPEETEWEYSARGAVAAARYGNLAEIAWIPDNGNGETHPVGLKKPNAFGLYDMLGNVWEWVNADPNSPSRIIRGDSVFVDTRFARASGRLAVAASDAKNGRGFRCAMDSLASNANESAANSGELAQGSGVAGEVFSAADGVSPPILFFKVDPEYSEEARKAKYEGVAVLSVVVDMEGRPRDIQVMKSLGMGLDEKAIEAVAKWRFKPAMKGGQPVNLRTVINVNFRLL